MKIKWCPNCFSCLKESETECPVCHLKPLDLSLEPQPRSEEDTTEE